LIDKLCGVKALNLIDPKTSEELREILSGKLGKNLEINQLQKEGV